MYKTVHAVLIISLLVIAYLFVKNLVGPNLTLLSNRLVPSWTISISMLPSLITAGLVLILFSQKNAVAFWGYLILTIEVLSRFIKTITTLAVTPNIMSSVNNQSAVLTIENIFLVIIFTGKLTICFMMWKLIERGELKYPENRWSSYP